MIGPGTRNCVTVCERPCASGRRRITAKLSDGARSCFADSGAPQPYLCTIHRAIFHTRLRSCFVPLCRVLEVTSSVKEPGIERANLLARGNLRSGNNSYFGVVSKQVNRDEQCVRHSAISNATNDNNNHKIRKRSDKSRRCPFHMFAPSFVLELTASNYV